MTHITYIFHINYITQIIHITHITYIIHIIYINHTRKLIFKAYKKTNEDIFNIFFLYTKIKNNYYSKHKERLRKEVCKRNENLSEEKKEKRRKKAQERYQNLT